MADVTSDQRLDVGLLQCGHIPALTPSCGDYPEAFSDLLAPTGADITAYDLTAGELPSLDAHPTWLVSGSADSVYDPLPWIAPTEAFLLDLLDRSVPVVAVCFGHQLLAQALGGKVARSEAGWGIGAHDYEILGAPAPWMDPPVDGPVRMIASHQDQVVVEPDGITVIARTDHCPVAAYTVGSALAVQPHPEFTREISRGLIDLRRERLGDELADAGIASLDEPLDREAVGSWMTSFLRAGLRG
jgi:GMP synthase-like glutamine amidotransferase